MLKHLMKDVQHMTAARMCRDHRIDAFAIEKCADTISMATQHACKNCHKFDRYAAFFYVLGPEINRWTKIQQKPGAQVAFFVILTDIRRLHASSNVPVDVANIIVVLVLAEVGEIQAKSAKQ